MALELPQFTKINEPFTCVQCGFLVPIAQQTCRDHCPKCLYSLHVDINPGDRAANCGGVLKPMAWSSHKKKGYVIHSICQKCQAVRVNKFLSFDSYCSDNFDALVALSSVTPR